MKLLVLIVLGVVALSTSPHQFLPTLFPYMDKVGHIVAYFVVTLLLSQYTTIRKSVFLAIVLGIALEGAQYFIPTRGVEVLDLVANLAGAVVCWGIVSVRNQLFATKRMKCNESA